MTIYFVRKGEAGPIKIGFSTSVDARIKQLQTGHFEKLVLMGTIPGTMNDERSIHEEFRDHRLSGEWFDPSPDLVLTINRIIQLQLPWFHCREIRMQFSIARLQSCWETVFKSEPDDDFGYERKNLAEILKSLRVMTKIKDKSNKQRQLKGYWYPKIRSFQTDTAYRPAIYLFAWDQSVASGFLYTRN